MSKPDTKTQHMTPQDVIDSYEKYGDDFMIINLEKHKKYDKTFFINMNFKKVNVKELIKPVLKFLNITSAVSIKEPALRNYEQLKFALRYNDMSNPDSKCGKAMKIICETYVNKVKQMVDNKEITDDRKVKNALLLPSVKPKTPMQDIAEKDGEMVELDNPMFWINLNINKFLSKQEISKLPIMTDVRYLKAETVTPYIKDFDINIYNFESADGKIVKCEIATDENGMKYNNSNIQNFLKYGSIVSGSIMFQTIVSASGNFNLNAKLYKSIYVEKSKYSDKAENIDDDDISEMLAFSTLNSKKELPKEETFNDVEKEEEIDDEEDEEEEELPKKGKKKVVSDSDSE